MTEAEQPWWRANTWTPPILVGNRVRLRPLRESDTPAVFAYSSNPNMTHYTLWDTHRDISESRFFAVDYAQSRYREQVPEPMAIVPLDDAEDRLIGTVGIFWVSRLSGTMELGYSIAEPYWGQGFATEASRILIDFVFMQYPIERIQGRCVDLNTASAKVLEKTGMRYEGTLRHALLRRGRYWNLQYFSLLRAEWEAQRPTQEPTD